MSDRDARHCRSTNADPQRSRREAEERAKLAAIRNALDEAEAAIDAGDVAEYIPSLLDEIDRDGRRGKSSRRR
jgi:hypothetical protein